MAASSVQMPGPRATTLGFEDYSLYSGLSEDELIEMAIERSLAEAHAATTQTGSAKLPALQVRQNPVRQNPTVWQTTRPREQHVPPPANPPRCVWVTAVPCCAIC